MMDLTRGPTFRNMLLFSLPIMLQGSFHIAYNLVDRFWVGQLGKEALAAVSVGFPVIFFMFALLFGLGVGAGIMVAQYRGAGKRDLVNLTARNFIVFGALAVLIVSAVMLVSVGGILRLLNTPAEIFQSAQTYLRWIFAALLFFFGFNGATGIFRGLGDSRTPTIVAAITTVLNIILDPLLIYGLWFFPRLEVAGAAIATVIANAIGTVIIFALLARQREYVSLSPRGFSFDWKVIRDILRIGLPTSGTIVMVSLSSMVLMRLVNGFGTAAVAGFGIGIVLDHLLMMPAQSFGMSMSTISGQNLGAGEKERVYKSLRETLVLSGAVGVTGAIVLNLIVEPLTSAYTRDAADFEVVFPYVLIYVRIMTVRYFIMGIFFPILGTIRGAGDTMAAMVISAFNQLVIRIPAAILLSSWLGFAGVPLAMSIAPIFGLTIVSLYYRSRRWETRGGLVDLKPGVVTQPSDAPE